jgi:class 3 adenylate cyclase/tetratricopeptide (TPR) repeat protein
MAELREWLKNIGLEQLAGVLTENDIDFDILPDLTDPDLEKLGISLGHRRRLLKAISGLTATPPVRPVGQTPTTSSATNAPEAERRQVTVFFSDLVGSTALASAIDPEEMSQLLRRYQDVCAGAVARFDGYLAKFMGDGVLAYFGYPQAHEDAAERAVHAGLAIMATIGGIERPDGRKLEARVGIATGLVVVGDIVGTGAAQERTIVGETPNLAARLQSLAAPDTILISETTRRLVGEMFDVEAIGEQNLKGFASAITVWRVRGEASVESRFAAIHAGRKSPFVGRTHEMALLLDRWRLSRGGEGQIVTLIGEAGIGKSRSLEALQETLATEPHSRVHLQCSPYHSDSALYPVIQHLSRAAQFAKADPPSTRLEKLCTLFATRGAAEPTAIPMLAELLGIPEPNTSESMTSAQRKAAIITLLLEEFLRLGNTNPVLLVLEDAHWIDPTTLELMTRLTDRIGSARLFVVVTARPEFTPPWLARPHATLLTLGRLSRAECALLVAGASHSRDLSAETIATIVAKTDGVPLFVEELTKSVVEAPRQESAVIPATLQDSLMTRLDRLGGAREIAQIASVIGRQFTFGLLQAIAPHRVAELEGALIRLEAAGIVFPKAGEQDRTYAFKHALVRDAAYESLLVARRRDWHERIARALEEQFPEIAANEPELLAHHFGASGLPLPACDYRMRAGDRAISRSAYNEAIGHFSAGLKLAETLPNSVERTRRCLDFSLKLGPALMVVRGMQSSEVEDTYQRASELGDSVNDLFALYKAKWGLWLSANVRRKTALARDRANELMDLARRSHDGDLLLEAYHCGWSTAFFRGEVAATLDLGRIGVETYEIDRHRHLGPAFGGHDPGVCAHVSSAISLALANDWESAQQGIAQALALGEALDHPNSLAHALYDSAICYQLVTDREATFTTAERALGLAEKFGLTPYRASSLVLIGWATAVGPGIDEAARIIASVVDQAGATGPVPQYYLGLASEVLLAAGRPAEALDLLNRAIASIDEPGVGFYLPEIYRLLGECLLAVSLGNHDEAKQAFITGRDIACRQGTVILERRAEVSLRAIENS